MQITLLESSYPLSFRQEDAVKLGQYIKNRQNVVLVGMKRVGISNFLRFFLFHEQTVPTYIDDEQKHLLIAIDLHDLVEREVFAFWVLLLKRISDVSEQLDLSVKSKQKIENIFLTSIQSQDVFMVIDGVRKILRELTENDFLPTLFFLRFDRIAGAIHPDFFANLQGLLDATHTKVSYVFTSYRSLDFLAPTVFTQPSMSVFSRTVFLKPAKKKDMQMIYAMYSQKFALNLPEKFLTYLLSLTDGYVQYLQLSLIILHEKNDFDLTDRQLFTLLIDDERINLQSEELYESLSTLEQSILHKVIQEKKISKDERKQAAYLFDTGMIEEIDGELLLFSPLFTYYIRQKEGIKKDKKKAVEFTKKENLLSTLLEKNCNIVCEREEIIAAVWPEVEELGVSDWAIDRLVARVRNKMQLQHSHYEIQTVKTRGYKLVLAQ